MYFQRKSQFIREVRIGLYSQNLSLINKQIEDYNRYNHNNDKISIENIFEQICTNPFDADWFRTLPQELYDNCISIILINAALLCSPADEAFALLQEECATGDGHSSDYLHLILTEQLLLRGCIQEAQESLECISEDYRDNAAVYKGWLNFLRGDNQQAIAYYTTGLKALKKATGKRQVYFSTMGGLFFILALLKDGSRDSLQEALDYTSLLARQSDHWLRSIYAQLKILLQVQLGDIAQKEFILSNRILFPEEHNSLETLFFALCHYWEDAPTTRVEIVKGEPELIVKKGRRDRLTLEFSPKLEASQNILAVKETPTRIKVIEISAEHRRVAEIIGKENRLNVPATAQKQVLAAINAVSGIVTVHSDIGGGMEGAEEVPAQTIPHIHLLPANAGLKVSLLSRPFAQGGPYYRPGAGGETVIAEIDGKRLQTRRSSKRVVQRFTQII